MPKWDPPIDDPKLYVLFKRQNICTTTIKPKDIHKAIEKYYPDCKYPAFLQLLWSKAGEYDISTRLKGARFQGE